MSRRDVGRMRTEAGPTRDDYLSPTEYIDSDSQQIARFVGEALQGLSRGLSRADDAARAIRLFEAVRDGLRYDPYSISFDPEDYRASAVLRTNAAFCVPKAILLTACLRRAGIPAAVGFADVRNHLNSAKLSELMGTDVFRYHGYVQLWLGEASYKVTPAFNIELCDRFGVKPLVFDGRSDALFHEADAAGRRHMEYLDDRGICLDPPVQEILDDFTRSYPRLREMRLSQLRPADPSFDGLRRFEDFVPGERFEFEVPPISEERLMAFAREWDPQPLHLDREYAAARHGGLIAPGFLTVMEAMRPVIREIFCGTDNLGGLGIENLRWTAPLRPGDALKVRLEITDLRASSSKPDRGVMRYRVEACNAADEVVLQLDSAAMIRRRPS